MRNFLVISSIYLMLFGHLFGAEVPQISVFDQIPEAAKKNIQKNEIYANSVVNSGQDWQTLDFQIVGETEKICRDTLRKLSRYETYSQYVGFIKKSTYDDDKGKVHFELSSSLLPFDMILEFKLPRINKPGSYPFSFDNGFLKELKGVIQVEDHNGKCLFFTTATWRGKPTGIPDSILSFFSQALSKLSMENMFRIAK